MLWGVIHSLDSLHTERPRKVCCDFGYHPTEELIEVVFPTTIVCQSVTITLVTNEVAEIKVVHSEIGEPFLYRQTLAEHHQASHCKAFFARCPVNDITTKILEECFVVSFIPHVTIVPELEQYTVTVQGVQVDVVHIVMLQQHAIIALLKRVSYHCPHLTFCTMIITFVVPPISSLIHIAIQIYGLYPPIGLWYIDTYYLHTVHLDRINVITGKDIFIHLIAVDGIPEILDNLLCIINTNDLKTLLNIRFFTVLLDAQQNHSADSVSKCRVCLPHRFWNLGFCPFAFQSHTLTIL